MQNTVVPSDALDVALCDALNDARRDDSAGVIGPKQGTNKDTNQDTVQEKITARIPEFCVVPSRRYCSAIRQSIIPIEIALFHKTDL